MPPFPGVRMQHTLTSCPVTPNYYHRSLHQVGVQFMDCNPSFARETTTLLWSQITTQNGNRLPLRLNMMVIFLLTLYSFRLSHGLESRRILTLTMEDTFKTRLWHNQPLTQGIRKNIFILTTPKRMMGSRMLTNTLRPFYKKTSNKEKKWLIMLHPSLWAY